MKIGLIGSSYNQRSLPFNAQRMINLFPVFDEQGKEVAALYGTSGFSSFATAGSGPIRASFTSTKGRMFVVSGVKLYEVDSSGVATERGTILSATGDITIDENKDQMMICDGDDGYIFTYSTNAFAQIVDADFPSAGGVTNNDGYFIVNQNDSGRFYISALNDGTSWNALDFATAESSPDNLLRVLRALGQLWMFGNKTTEIWTNTGDSAFPFQKISGAELTVGILAPLTAKEFSSSVFWLGESADGYGVVYRAKGFSPQRISTESIEYAISKATNKSDIKALIYQEEGHEFYMLTGGGLETSLVYDVATNLWHERAYLTNTGDLEPHIANSITFAFGYHLIGDRRNGNIYKLSQDVYSDNGEAILRRRVYTHISDEGKNLKFSQLQIGFETGVGLQSGQGSNPLVSLQLSTDGARTWSDSYTAPIGAVGKYLTDVTFRRLGIAKQMTFQISVTDPIKIAIIGSYLK